MGNRFLFYTTLIRKLVLKNRLSLFLLLFSILIVSFIFVISLSILLGLQDEQIRLLRDIENFDIQVKYSDISLEELRKISSVDDVYLCCDNLFFTQSSSTSIKRRFCDPFLFENDRFKRNFDFFPNVYPPDKDFIFVSSFVPEYRTDDMFFISKGKNGRANVFKENLEHADIFSTRYSTADNIIYENIFSENGAIPFKYGEREYLLNGKILNLDGIYYGIYTKNLSQLSSELRKRNIPFQTYKTLSKSIYSALIIERVVFFVILFFVLVILLILIYRLFLRFLTEDKKKIATLMTLGLDRLGINLTFAMPCIVLIALSIFVGAICGYYFIISKKIVNYIFLAFFDSISTLNFKMGLNLIGVYIAFSLIAILIMSELVINKIKKIDVIDLVKKNKE